ncbi:hypothetical protein BGX26_003889 [Mortierella sp. AD094]|nr:hypothetical protein BGX26_003889 [Mortierella sp. AD094]
MSCPTGYSFGFETQKKPSAATTNALKPGDLFRCWDHEAIWTEDHIHASCLEALRKVGDELADDALLALNVKPDQDAYKAFVSYVARPESEQESPAPGLLMEQLMTIPEWADWESMRRGQEVFWVCHSKVQ